jgi:hypothetical protein
MYTYKGLPALEFMGRWFRAHDPQLRRWRRYHYHPPGYPFIFFTFSRHVQKNKNKSVLAECFIIYQVFRHCRIFYGAMVD